MNTTEMPEKISQSPSSAQATDTAAPGPACGVNESCRKPVYSVSNHEDAYEVRIEMPGVSKPGVKIDFEDKVLTVRGERSAVSKNEWKPLHRELSPLSYQIRLRLNIPVDEDRLTATMESGVLTLSLPLREAAKPRRIEVQ